MRILKATCLWLACIVAVSVLSTQDGSAQPPSAIKNAPRRVGDVAVADILQRMGAKQEQGSTAKELDDYTNHFNRTDPNRDGKHTKEEYVHNGGYMTPQARAGIFRAADGNADGVVTRAEYVLNRVITDEAKRIVQGMDDDKDGSVERAEFVQHAAKLLSDRKLAEQVYAAFDANDDSTITIPEYLRVWGQWARLGQKSAEERIAKRRAKLAESAGEDVIAEKPGKKPVGSGEGRRPDGPPSGQPGAGGGPPSVDEVFKRFDGNKDGNDNSPILGYSPWTRGRSAYRVVSEVLREHAPDILYLGSRIHGSGEPRAAYLAAAKYCDVVSMNRYQFVIAHEDLPAEAVDKPMIIGEFHFGALDRGLLHTGLRSVINQRQRGRAYVDYVRQAVENDRIVGAHWFQYTDQLVTGRGDGENYQIGFVDIVDRPYAEMIDASRRMADTLYEYRSSRR